LIKRTDFACLPMGRLEYLLVQSDAAHQGRI